MKKTSLIPIGNFPMPSKVAYQGVEGAFSYITAKKVFGEKALLQGFPTFKETFEAVEKGLAEVAVLPIENTLAGTIYETIDLLSQGTLHIIGASTTRIELSVLALPGASIKELKKILSHEKALEQCSYFFAENPHIKAVPYYNTAGAAADVAKGGDREVGAIAHAQVAEIYGLTVLAEGVQNHKENFTRFLLVSKKESEGGYGLAVLCFTLPHRPGSLAEVLTFLAGQGVNLTYLVSRPLIGKPFEYLFYVELDYFKPAILSALSQKVESLKILGSFSS